MEKLELEMKLEILKKTYESSFLKNIFCTCLAVSDMPQ